MKKKATFPRINLYLTFPDKFGRRDIAFDRQIV